jgi:hypothetical protein
MEISGIVTILLTGAAVVALSSFLDHVWSAAMPLRILYYAIRAPGVVVHECAHILGCLLTGAQVRDVVFFSRDGGSVTYARPLLPCLGEVIISTAPLFVIPLVLSSLTFVFSTYLGCFFPAFPASLQSVDAILTLGGAILSTLQVNLVTRFNGWFLLFLYLTISLVLSAAPSSQDMKNAAIGIFLILMAGIIIVWTGFSPAVYLLNGGMYLLEIGFTLGLVYGSIALIITSPLIFWYGYTRSS